MFANCLSRSFRLFAAPMGTPTVPSANCVRTPAANKKALPSSSSSPATVRYNGFVDVLETGL